MRSYELKLQQIRDLPLRDVVFETLRAAILEGGLKPGERLMEIHLARQLGVSRTPVREAIRMLEQEGLVLTIPRRGAVVAEITLKDMEDVLEVRLALEELAVTEVCALKDERSLSEIREAALRFERLANAGDLEGSARADAEFHEKISDATGNRRLIQLLGNLREQFFRYRLENLKDKSCYPDLIKQHKALCEALESGDEESARAVIRAHIKMQRVLIAEKLKLEEE